jgi:DNA-binding NarL/FixJ family response regulator
MRELPQPPTGAIEIASVAPAEDAASPIRVFVCDDSAAERFLLGQLIKEQPDLYVAGAASTAIGAVRAIEAAQPDVVILDHLDHEGDVSVIVGAIRQAASGVKIVIYSAIDERGVIGVESADGYVGKGSDQEPLWAAIRGLARAG